MAKKASKKTVAEEKSAVLAITEEKALVPNDVPVEHNEQTINKAESVAETVEVGSIEKKTIVASAVDYVAAEDIKPNSESSADEEHAIVALPKEITDEYRLKVEIPDEVAEKMAKNESRHKHEKKSEDKPVAEIKSETPAVEAATSPEKSKRGRKATEKKLEDKVAPEKKAKGGRKPKAEKKEEKAVVAEKTPAPAPEKPKRGRKTAAEKKAEDKPVAEKKTRGGRKPAAEKKAPEKATVKEKANKESKAKKPATEKKAPAKKAAPAAKAVSDSFVIQSNGKDYTMESIKKLCRDKYRNGTRKQVKSTEVFITVYDGKLRAYYVINGVGGEDCYIEL